jgi:hypothetical protein
VTINDSRDYPAIEDPWKSKMVLLRYECGYGLLIFPVTLQLQPMRIVPTTTPTIGCSFWPIILNWRFHRDSATGYSCKDNEITKMIAESRKTNPPRTTLLSGNDLPLNYV